MRCGSLVWCRRGESNPRHRDYETLALPLSYAGPRQCSMLRTSEQRCQEHRLSSIILSPLNGNVKMSPHETGDIHARSDGTGIAGTKASLWPHLGPGLVLPYR